MFSMTEHKISPNPATVPQIISEGLLIDAPCGDYLPDSFDLIAIWLIESVNAHLVNGVFANSQLMEKFENTSSKSTDLFFKFGSDYYSNFEQSWKIAKSKCFDGFLSKCFNCTLRTKILDLGVTKTIFFKKAYFTSKSHTQIKSTENFTEEC